MKLLTFITLIGFLYPSAHCFSQEKTTETSIKQGRYYLPWFASKDTWRDKTSVETRLDVLFSNYEGQAFPVLKTHKSLPLDQSSSLLNKAADKRSLEKELEHAFKVLEKEDNPTLVFYLGAHGARTFFQVGDNGDNDERCKVSYKGLFELLTKQLLKFHEKKNWKQSPQLILIMNACHAGSLVEEFQKEMEKEWKDWPVPIDILTEKGSRGPKSPYRIDIIASSEAQKESYGEYFVDSFIKVLERKSRNRFDPLGLTDEDMFLLASQKSLASGQNQVWSSYRDLALISLKFWNQPTTNLEVVEVEKKSDREIRDKDVVYFTQSPVWTGTEFLRSHYKTENACLYQTEFLKLIQKASKENTLDFCSSTYKGQSIEVLGEFLRKAQSDCQKKMKAPTGFYPQAYKTVIDQAPSASTERCLDQILGNSIQKIQQSSERIEITPAEKSLIKAWTQDKLLRKDLDPAFMSNLETLIGPN